MNKIRKKKIFDLSIELSKGGEHEDIQTELEALIGKELNSQRQFAKQENIEAEAHSKWSQKMMSEALEDLEANDTKEAIKKLEAIAKSSPEDHKPKPEPATPVKDEYRGIKVLDTLTIWDEDYEDRKQASAERVRTINIEKHGWDPDEYDAYLNSTPETV